ncbi:hypothetical protein ES703_76362 [subsurface metagenome]
MSGIIIITINPIANIPIFFWWELTIIKPLPCFFINKNPYTSIIIPNTINPIKPRIKDADCSRFKPSKANVGKLKKTNPKIIPIIKKRSARA